MADEAFWQNIISILGVVCTGVGIAAGFIAAYFFGDYAGQRRAENYEKKRDRKARILALRTLRSYVGLIQKLAESNVNEEYAGLGGLNKIPVNAFEIAFVSSESAIEAGPELRDAVYEYLSKAYTINAAIDMYVRLKTSLNRETQTSLDKVTEGCSSLLGVLNELSASLEKELEKALAEKLRP
jgi:hypothetical protein